MLDIQVMDGRNPREKWVRTRLPSIQDAALVAGYALTHELVGHRWVRANLKRTDRGRTCSLTLVCEWRNRSWPQIDEASLRAVVAAAISLAAAGPETEETPAAPTS